MFYDNDIAIKQAVAIIQDYEKWRGQLNPKSIELHYSEDCVDKSYLTSAMEYIRSHFVEDDDQWPPHQYWFGSP